MEFVGAIGRLRDVSRNAGQRLSFPHPYRPIQTIDWYLVVDYRRRVVGPSLHWTSRHRKLPLLVSATNFTTMKR